MFKIEIDWKLYAGIYLAVLGILVSIYFGKLSSTGYKIIYNTFAPMAQLSKDKLPYSDNISISYKGKPIDNLSQINILLYNPGPKTIEYSEFINNRDLKVVFPDNWVIHNIDISYSTNEDNNFLVRELNRNEYKVEFDYIDKKQGCIIEILTEIKKATPEPMKHDKFKVMGVTKDQGNIGEMNSYSSRKVFFLFVTMILMILHFNVIIHIFNTRPSWLKIIVFLITFYPIMILMGHIADDNMVRIPMKLLNAFWYQDPNLL